MHSLECDGAGIRGANAHLVFRAINHEARRLGGHQERGNALLAQRRVSHRKHNGQLGALAVADKLLGAIDDPLAITQFSAGPQVVGFGAGLGFGQAEAADGLAAGKVRQPGLFLLVCRS